jgi:hypothetical protein
MLLFKPRSWCVYCPMGTMTQGICKLKNRWWLAASRLSLAKNIEEKGMFHGTSPILN